MNDLKLKLLIFCSGTLLGGLLYFVPPRVEYKEVEKIVEKKVVEEKVVEKKVDVVKWRNREIVKTVRELGGKEIVTVTREVQGETDKTKETAKEAKQTEEKQSERTVERIAHRFRVGVDVIDSPRTWSTNPELAVTGGIRALGGVWVTGVVGGTYVKELAFRPRVGVGLSVEF